MGPSGPVGPGGAPAGGGAGGGRLALIGGLVAVVVLLLITVVVLLLGRDDPAPPTADPPPPVQPEPAPEPDPETDPDPESDPEADPDPDPDSLDPVAPITIVHAYTGTTADAFQVLVRDFTAATGVDAEVQVVSDPSGVAAQAAAQDADLAVVFAPELARAVAQGHALPLDGLVDVGTLAADLWPGLLDAGRVDGQVHGFPVGVQPKSLVWYDPGAFAAGGYAIPATWEELLTLSEELVADGRTPWCVGIESGGATGWVVTDWIEDAVLRLHGPEVYDAWVVNEVPFDSDPLRAAIEGYVSPVLFGSGFVAGGSEGMVETSFVDSPQGLFDGSCVMHRQALFATLFFPPGTVVGEDVEVFALPPIAAGSGAASQVVAGELVTVVNDTPGAVAFLTYLGSPRAGEVWADQGDGIAALRVIPPQRYPRAEVQRVVELLSDVEVMRYDGSDLMPFEIGADSFWREATDWVRRDGAELDAMLRRIDADWP